jgi:transposase InsO family protein
MGVFRSRADASEQVIRLKGLAQVTDAASGESALPDTAINIHRDQEVWNELPRSNRHRRADLDGGRGRWMDNVFIERLWRSLKYECVYLHAFETGSELRTGLAGWIGYYNARRPHATLAGRTPDEAYWADGATKLAA